MSAPTHRLALRPFIPAKQPFWPPGVLRWFALIYGQRTNHCLTSPMATRSAVTHVATSSSLHSKSSANHHDGLLPSARASFNSPDLYRPLRAPTPSPELNDHSDRFPP